MRYISKRKNLRENNNCPMKANQAISANLDENLRELKERLEGCSDAVLKEFNFGRDFKKRALLIYFDGLVDRKELEEHLLKPIMLEVNMLQDFVLDQDNLAIIKENILSLADLKMLESIDELCHHINSGDTVLLIDGSSKGLVAGTRLWQGRPVQTPENEVVIFGPKEGFSETLRFNTALLRRRIKSSSLKMESFVLGRITRTDVVLCYIEGIAPPALVEEIKQRLEKIDIDAVLDSNYITELIVDYKKTLFSQVEHTEKPDHVCGQLLEGRVSIMVDGSPMALILPVSFPQFWISPEDYYTHYYAASLFRILRFLAFWVALLLPSLYVAVISYHHEMIPTDLLLTIAATHRGVPFPAFVEALIMETTFEMLREAGLRLPRAVGPAVSIVGALIIGDAAVRAGLVSTPMVVVVAFTGIASFISPSYSAGMIIRIARFAFLFSSALLGFLGIMIMLLLMLSRMVSLSSFGLPYLSPLAPFDLKQITDIVVRRPWFSNTQRPYLEGMLNQQRQNRGE
jgi:spore germination protein KA